MANPDFGYCVCLVCRYERAAIRVATNGKAYITCEECVTNVRSLSSVGDRAIRAMMTSRADGAPLGPQPAPGAVAAAAAAAAAPPGEVKPAEVKPTKKRGAFDDALGVLTGGR